MFVQSETEDDMQVFCYDPSKHDELSGYSESKRCITVSLSPNKNKFMVLADKSLIEKVQPTDVNFIYDPTKHIKKVRTPVTKKTLLEVKSLRDDVLNSHQFWSTILHRSKGHSWDTMMHRNYSICK